MFDKSKLEAKMCIANWARDQMFQIRVDDGGQFMVDLRQKTCSCRRYDLSGLPCLHAICVISSRDIDPLDFVDPCYKKKSIH